MIIKNNTLPFKGFAAMAVFPFVFVRKDWAESNRVNTKKFEEVMNHERIHWIQQVEVCLLSLVITFVTFGFGWHLLLSYLIFYILYLINWILEGIKMLSGGDKEVYKDIIFEREAKCNQANLSYISNRRLFSFFKYIKNK